MSLDLAARFGVRAPTLERPTWGLADIEGVRVSGVVAGIKTSGKPDVALLVADRPLTAQAVFTQNKLAAAPVTLSRRHLEATSGRVRAVVVNSGNANACTGRRGELDALAMARVTARLVGCAVEEVLVASTGVIGRPLPMGAVEQGIEAAFETLGTGRGAHDAFLRAIMTTDAFPKEAAREADGARIAGVAKGAGMIEPQMATMLAFVVTEAEIVPGDVADAARTSFNAIWVDGHTSTNDTLVVLSTATHPRAHDGLKEVCERLAWLIARDGEGSNKVTTLRVKGASSPAAADAIARKIASSGLVRTALFGRDPNWGRFASQVANCSDCGDASRLSVTLGGIPVFRAGEPLPFDAAAASASMDAEDLRLDIGLEDGDGAARLFVSDLGYKYVEVNAEYTT